MTRSRLRVVSLRARMRRRITWGWQGKLCRASLRRCRQRAWDLTFLELCPVVGLPQ